MPLSREPIFHDRQDTASVVPQNTTLINTFEDIVGATLTTKDLNQLSNYDIEFFPEVAASVANTLVTFRSLVNGVAAGDDRTTVVKTSNFDISKPVVGHIDDVEEGDVIQIQIKTDKGVVTIEQYTLKIDGIPESRIVT